MKKVKEIKAFRGVRMNLDVAPELAQPNEVREVYNMIEDALSGKISNMKGFENVLSLPVNTGFAFSLGANKCIGTCRDVEGSAIIYFILNDRSNHGIVSMDTVTKRLTWVLKDEPLLNFKTGYKVKANVIQGLLYWTDGYFGSFLNSDFNPPRKINIAKAVAYTAAVKWAFQSAAEAGAYTGNPDYDDYTVYISSTPFMQYSDGYKVVAFALDGINRKKEITGYGTVVDDGYLNNKYFIITTRPWQLTDATLTLPGHIMVYHPNMYFGIDWQVMDVVKHPPTTKPTASFDDNYENLTNNLKKNLYQFKYRWRYDDNEWSVFSPVSLIPIPVFDDTVTGFLGNNYYLRDNVINVWSQSGPMEAISVQVAMRRGNIGSWIVIDEKLKYDIDGNLLIWNDISIMSSFTNNEVLRGLDQADSERAYDTVPTSAGVQDIIEKNRLILGDYTEGFDIPELDVTVTCDKKTVEFKTNSTTSRGCRVLPYFVFGEGFNANYATTIIDLFYVFPTAYTSGDYDGKRWDFSITLRRGNGDLIVSANVSYTSTSSDTLQTITNELARLLQFQHVMAMTKEVTIQQYSPVVPQVLSMTDYTQILPNEFAIMTGYDDSQTSTTCNWLEANFSIQTRLSFDIENYTSNEVSTFKAGAYHPIALSYYDKAERHVGALTKKEMVVYVPQQTEYYKEKVGTRNYLKWDINHIPPTFATHYRILYAKNTTKSTYIQFASWAEKHGSVIRIATPNVYNVWTKEFTPKFSMPTYEFDQGDKVRFLYAIKKTNPVATEWEYLSGGIYESFIVSETLPESGLSYLSIEITPSIASLDIGNYDYIIELIKPSSQTSEQDLVYYETGEEFEIGNPNTENRYHKGASLTASEDVSWQRDQVVSNGISQQSARGILWNGDAYLRQRTIRYSAPDYIEDIYRTFIVEDKSLSDYYTSDSVNIGRALIAITAMRFQRYISNLRYGGRLIQDTRINDISRFEGADFVSLADKYGAIHHIEEVGDMVKVLQKSKVSHLLVGRAGVTQPNEEGTQIMSSTKDVLGTLILQKSEFGTQHGGSVVRFENRLYWFDFDAASICRDPGNGIQNLTETFGLKRFMEEQVAAFGSASNIDVVSGYDQANEIVWWTFTDFTTAANSFTVGFRDTGGRTQDGFVLFTNALPDFYGQSKYTLTSFKDNAIWLHNSDNVPRCNFYGTQYEYWVTVIANESPANVKRFKQIAVSTNAPVSAPDAGDITIEPCGNHPEGMVSLLKEAAFTSVHGKYVADFGRNMTTNSPTPTLDDLINGDDLEGQAMTIKLQGDQTTEHKIFTVEIEEIVNE